MQDRDKDKTIEVANKGASAAGFHFYQLYQCCPYKFYLRNIRGLDTATKSPALIRGDAVHQGLEHFYATGELQASLDLTRAVVDSYDDEFDSDEVAERTAKTALGMVESWASAYGQADFDTYQEFALEQELELPLLSAEGDETDKRATVRIDRLAYSEADDAWDMFDTKTSTYSKDFTEAAFALSDQPTLYIAACQHALGIKIRHVYCDIAYFHSRVKAPSPYRGMPLTRSDLEVQQLLESMRETFLDIDVRTEDVLEARRKPHEAFPRNTHYCMSYNRRCEFASVCRLANGIKDRIPLIDGIKQGQKLRALGSYTTDSIGVGR